MRSASSSVTIFRSRRTRTWTTSSSVGSVTLAVNVTGSPGWTTPGFTSSSILRSLAPKNWMLAAAGLLPSFVSFTFTVPGLARLRKKAGAPNMSPLLSGTPPIEAFSCFGWSVMRITEPASTEPKAKETSFEAPAGTDAPRSPIGSMDAALSKLPPRGSTGLEGAGSGGPEPSPLQPATRAAAAMRRSRREGIPPISADGLTALR
jgi:hypothetical protein